MITNKQIKNILKDFIIDNIKSIKNDKYHCVFELIIDWEKYILKKQQNFSDLLKLNIDKFLSVKWINKNYILYKKIEWTLLSSKKYNKEVYIDFIDFLKLWHWKLEWNNSNFSIKKQNYDFNSIKRNSKHLWINIGELIENIRSIDYKDYSYAITHNNITLHNILYNKHNFYLIDFDTFWFWYLEDDIFWYLYYLYQEKIELDIIDWVVDRIKKIYGYTDGQINKFLLNFIYKNLWVFLSEKDYSFFLKDNLFFVVSTLKILKDIYNRN